MCHAHGLSPPALRSKTPYQPLTLPWRTNCPPSSAPLQLTSPMAILDSLTARQLLDAQAHGVSLDKPRQARQELDRNSTGSTGKASTAPRQRLELPRQRLDGASTSRQLDSQGSNERRTFTAKLKIDKDTGLSRIHIHVKSAFSGAGKFSIGNTVL